MEDGLGGRRQGPLRDRGGAGGEEIILFDHAVNSFIDRLAVIAF
jgi:hypothetical protein